MSSEPGPVVAILQQAGTYHTQLAAGLGTMLDAVSAPLVLSIWGSDSVAAPSSLARLLTDGRPRAVVVTPLADPRSDDELAALLAAAPAVPRLHLDLPGGDASVRVDNAQGMRLVADHLVTACGARRILLVRGRVHHVDSVERHEALVAELTRLGVPAQDQLVVDGHFDREVSYRAVRAALGVDPTIDAVAAFNDRSALGAMEAARSLGRRVPDDLVVTGFDDEDFAAVCRPTLTTVGRSPFAQGRVAGELLARLLRGESADHVRVPVALRTRASTGHPPVDASPQRRAGTGQMWSQVATLDAALSMSRDLMSCRTLEEIAATLAESLPLLGVRRGFLLLHDRDGAAAGTVVLTVDDGMVVRTAEHEPLDLARWLGRYREAHPQLGTLVVQTLSAADVELGHLVLEQRPRRDGYVTEALGIDLSRAIDTAHRTRWLETEVAARQAAQQALVFQANHDPLTGLLNRAAFLGRAEPVVEGRPAGGVGVLLVDIERFRDVNDTLGHAVGSALLVEVARRLEAVAGTDGLVCRLSGDAFALLVPGAADPAAGLAVAERILASLRAPFLLDGVTVEIDAGVGVSGTTDPARAATELLREADSAMQRAKAEHLGAAVFEPGLHVDASRRLALFGELRRALAQHELVVHYQPITNVSSGTVGSLEALVRWDHPTRGLLPPADFLEIAEQTGLIHPITSYVLDRAIADCRGWLDQGLALRVAVNLSARRLTDTGLVDEVGELLDRHGLPAENLVLEVTESAAMSDPRRALIVLEGLRDRGIQLSVDDFGTGYASLAYLSRLPVSSLKIDREFVQTMESDQANMTIVRSILDLARSLGLGVVAEGIETHSAYRTLSHYEGLRAQGYWLARPVPAQDVPAVVHDVQRRLAAQTAVPRPRTAGQEQVPDHAPTTP